jgi:anti-anti-sigma factor
MSTAIGQMIEMERLGNTLILTPQRDLRELEWQEIEAEQEDVLRLLQHDASICNVIVDLSRTDSFGSTALKLLALVRRCVRARGGRMAFCNISPHEEEILAAVGLVGLWPVYTSREVAIDALAG